MDKHAEDKRTEQNLIVRSSNSVAEVTDNTVLGYTIPAGPYRTAESNYR